MNQVKDNSEGNGHGKDQDSRSFFPKSQRILPNDRNYTGEYTFFSYMPGVSTVERFLHWWHVASRVSR